MTDSITAGTPPGRPAGIVLILLGLLSLALLSNHPSAASQSFADVLRGEATNRIADAIVHGGFIAVLGAQLACLAILSMRLGLDRASVIAAFVFTAIGSAALMLSMLLDGLVTPAIAARYVDVVDHHNDARILLVLLGTVVRFAMPVGLLFQTVGVIAWGVALRGRPRVPGAASWLGIVAGALAIVAIAASAGMVPHVMIGVILTTTLWFVGLGIGLVLRRI